MKRERHFKENDKVFAKIKGYPAWPAIILGKNGKKFKVQFYGTGETGFIKPEDMFYYLKNKEQMMKGSKKKEFKDAIDEIEKAIALDGTDGDDSQSSENEPEKKRKRTNSEKSVESNPSKKSLDEDSNQSATDLPSEPKIEIEEHTVNETKVEEEEEEEAPFLPNTEIVSELVLKNWINYADQVKENPTLYKSLPVYFRSHSEKQVFPVVTPSGKYIALKLHKNWPLSFTNEYECAMYDNDIASNLLSLKQLVEKGEMNPETHPDDFIVDFEMTESEIRRNFEMKIINNKYKRVERLRIESNLVQLDAKVKNCLKLNKAEPKKALEFLNEMLAINMDEIMLKKHSHVVEMIRRLRKYIGNVEEWNLDEQELQIFNEDAEKLRMKADEIYLKFKSVVKLPQETVNFWDGFNEIVKKFREDCKLLNNREVFILCAEPYSRQAIIDRLEQEEELQEADIHRPVEGEAEH